MPRLHLIHVAPIQLVSLVAVYIVKVKGKGSWIYIAPYCEKLASKALRYGSHSCYTANSPYPPLPRSIHQIAPPL